MKTVKGIKMFFVMNVFLLTGAVTGYAEDAPITVVDDAVGAVVTEVNAVVDAAVQEAAPVAASQDAAVTPTEPMAMTEEQKAMQMHMKEFSTVNEHHDLLKSLVGTWKTTVKFWMDPAGQPEESEGTSEAKMIMGGRFVEQAYNRTAMG